MYLIRDNSNEIYSEVKDDELLRVLYSFISGKSKYTARNYRVSIQQFIDFLGGDHHHLLTVEPFTIINFKNQLLKNHKVSTVATRLASISSLYKYLLLNGIIETNPVLMIDRGDLKVNPYENSKTLNMEEFNTILRSIPESKSGIRDRIIFQMIYISGLRRSSILNLMGKDITFSEGQVFFKVKLKGGSHSKKELPKPLWDQIQYYLECDNRKLENDECIFLPSTDSGVNLLEYYGRKRVSKGLSPEVLNQNLKRYSKSVGIENISLHSLRHLGAKMYYQLTKDILDTMNFLNHKNINTTQIYLHSLRGHRHNHWEGMINKLEI